MSFCFKLASSACAVWVAVGLSGCTPSGRSQLSEEKEPHFVLGKSRVNAMDYQNAIEAFEQSLEANPRSAMAHFELGWLYDEKTSDPAAAIYHYQQYLKLNPNADNADVIKQRIYRCKQQLAADVLPLPSAPAAQQQLERLSEQNRQLQDETAKWRAYYAGQLAAAKNSLTSSPVSRPLPPGANPTPTPSGQEVSLASPGSNPDRPDKSKPAADGPRTHTVVSGETAMSITRKCGVKLSALQAANPGVNLSRLRAGQVLNLPQP
jgi:tetratricopeptide (TPR) repeat protein